MSTMKNSKRSSKSEPKNRKKVKQIFVAYSSYRLSIGKTIAGVVTVIYLMAMYAVLRTGLVPGSYLLLSLPVLTLIVVGVVVATYRNSWKILWKNIVILMLCVLIVLSSGYVFMINTTTSNFLAAIQTGEYYDVSYSIITRKDSAVSERSGNHTYGYLSNDINNQDVMRAVHIKTLATPKSYNDLASLIAALDNKQIDSAVLLSSYTSLLSDNNPSEAAKLSVIDTFSVQIKKAYSAHSLDITKPYVIYISGIDTYGKVATVSRSDVNIMMVVNPKRHKILLVNTPRDYYVQLHGTTGVRDKLTHAGIYGIDMSVNTMEDLYATPINYYVRVNFSSLLTIIDAMGGVDVYSDNSFSVGKYHFITGYNHLDAKAALAFPANDTHLLTVTVRAVKISNELSRLSSIKPITL
jgi:LCP family protein required for cell wall assembly